MRRFSVLFLCLLLLGGCGSAPAANPTADGANAPPPASPSTAAVTKMPEDIVLATVDGVQIKSGEFGDMVLFFESLYQLMGQDANRYEGGREAFLDRVLEIMIEKQALLLEAGRRGLSGLNGEEIRVLESEYEAQLEERLAPYIENAEWEKRSDPSVDVGVRALERFDEDLAYQGMNREKLKSDIFDDYIINTKLYDSVVGDFELGGEGPREWYDEEVMYQTELFEQNPEAYEMYLGNDMALYTPSGIAYCRYIFLMVEEFSQRAGFREKAGEILEELKNGAVIEDIILREDKTAADPGQISIVYKGAAYPESFVEAALALEEEGDLSEVIEDENGFYIIVREYTPPQGATDFDSIEEKCEKLAFEAGKDKLWRDTASRIVEDAEITVAGEDLTRFFT